MLKLPFLLIAVFSSHTVIAAPLTCTSLGLTIAFDIVEKSIQSHRGNWGAYEIGHENSGEAARNQKFVVLKVGAHGNDSNKFKLTSEFVFKNDNQCELISSKIEFTNPSTEN